MGTKRNKFVTVRYRHILVPIGFAAGFAVIGVLLLTLARAATPTASLQPEDGSLSGSATTISDATASGGRAVSFVQASAGGATGVWTPVSPSGFVVQSGDCGLFGTTSVGVDPARPSDFYAKSDCNGIYKSTDYGQNWTGPINTGTDAGAINSCAGGISVARGSGTNPPTLYIACIRGGLNGAGGFARSVNGGVTWTWYSVGTVSGREDYYPPVVDPYDTDHLIIAGHEMDSIAQSTDGGQHWSNVPINSGMHAGNGTAFLYFVNTGDATTTRNTWLSIAQDSGGGIGTWRTANGGSSWTQVHHTEHPHGASQFFQPNTSGIVFMAGDYGDDGWGVYRSTNYGQTWAHVGFEGSETVVFGTPNRVYAGYSWACGGCNIDPSLQTALLPGATGWTRMTQPSGMTIGPAQIATSFDGTHYIMVSANWYKGLWRYVEP